MSAPLPSPAPTLDPSFPGFYPPTPATEDPPTSPAVGDQGQALDQDALLARAALEPVTSLPLTLETVENAITGAAAGLVARVGQLAGVPIAQVEGLDDLTRNLKPSSGQSTAATVNQNDSAQDSPGSAKTISLGEAPATVDETHRPEFGLDAVQKEQDALAASPAQRLLEEAADGNEAADTGHSGAGLAAGAGALGGAALLAGAAGAKIDDHEVREPGLADDVAERKGLVEPTDAADSTADPASITTAPDYGTPAIEKEQAALAASPAQQLLRTDTPSSATAIRTDEAALLAGAAGAKLGATHEIEEPAKAPLDVATDKAVEAGAGLPANPHGDGAHVVPLEREISEPVAPLTSASEDRPNLPTPHGSTTSFSADVLAAGEGIQTPTEAPGPAAAGFGLREPGEIVATDHGLGDEPRRSDQVVHNPEPILPAAVIGSAAADAALMQDAPQDFQPYTPPIVETTEGLKQAAAIPIPETPRQELTPVDSHSTSDTVVPIGATATPLLDPTATYVPETVTAQNLDTAVPSTFSTAPATPGSEQIEMGKALDEGPAAAQQRRADKGKGKEVLGAAGLGTAGVGAGIGMKELLESDRRDDAHAAHDALLDDQRAFPTVPHMLDSKPMSGTTTDEAAPHALDPQQLAASSPVMTPEQAGFAPTAGPTVAGGAHGFTPAMEDFAHLSEPAPTATTAAGPVVEAPISAEQYEAEKDQHDKGPVIAAAGAGLAGVGAGAAGATMLSSEDGSAGVRGTGQPYGRPVRAIETGAPAALSPVAAAASGPTTTTTGGPATATSSTLNEPPVNQAMGGPAVQPAPTASQASAAAPAALAAGVPVSEQQADKRTPVSRFTEEKFYPSAAGSETPSSTRAVLGSAPSSAATTPLQSTTPTQSLFEAGILEKSPHMKIHTHKVDGHKRLHRKSLSGAVTPVGSISRRGGSGGSPGASPRASGEIQRGEAGQPLSAAPAAFGANGPATVASAGPYSSHYQQHRAPAVNQEGRRDRMVDMLAGVHDPTSGGYDAGPYTGGAAGMSAASSTPARNPGMAQTYSGAPPVGHTTATFAPGPIAAAPGPAAAAHGRASGRQDPALYAGQPHAVPQQPQQPGQSIKTDGIASNVDSNGNQHRKLQKKHVPASVAAPGTQSSGSSGTGKEKGSGFLSRVFGGGHK